MRDNKARSGRMNGKTHGRTLRSQDTDTLAIMAGLGDRQAAIELASRTDWEG